MLFFPSASLQFSINKTPVDLRWSSGFTTHSKVTLSLDMRKILFWEEKKQSPLMPPVTRSPSSIIHRMQFHYPVSHQDDAYY